MDATLRCFSTLRRYYDQNSLQEAQLYMRNLDNESFYHAIMHGRYERSFNTFLGVQLIHRHDARIFEQKYASQCELFDLISHWFITHRENPPLPTPFQPNLHYPYTILPGQPLLAAEVRSYYRDYIDTTQERQHPLSTEYCRFFTFHIPRESTLTYCTTLVDMILRDPLLKEYHHHNFDDTYELLKNGTEHLYLDRLRTDLHAIEHANRQWHDPVVNAYGEWFTLLLDGHATPYIRDVYQTLAPESSLNAPSWHYALEHPHGEVHFAKQSPAW